MYTGGYFFPGHGYCPGYIIIIIIILLQNKILMGTSLVGHKNTRRWQSFQLFYRNCRLSWK